MRQEIAALVIWLIAVSANAQTNVPHSFSSGQPARASEVNANFNTLGNAINALAARIDRIEGGALTNASIAGAYRIFGFQTGLFAGTTSGLVEAITYSGTLTLLADGTYKGSLVEVANVLGGLNSGGPPTIQTRINHDDPALVCSFLVGSQPCPGESLGGTYTISQNTRLTLNTFGSADSVDFYGGAGAQILVATPLVERDLVNRLRTNVLLILVRTK